VVVVLVVDVEVNKAAEVVVVASTTLPVKAMTVESSF
jgi:hypothetical protein